MPAGLEIEVKFLVADLEEIERRLVALGAPCIQPRVFERNLRFDTPAGDLARARRVLRLRQDTRSTLTYKGPPEDDVAVSARQELEVQVADAPATRQLLEALGFQVSWIYEKTRATYALEGQHVMLDSLPFGEFVEVEGEDSEVVERAARTLGLDWGARILEGYSVLFRRLLAQGLAPANLTFEEFSGIQVSPSALGVSVALMHS
jgi:adenylate cyclase class 2